ncbi:MAG TPA: hypothetical protein VNZ54_04930, partial [bacterium]|nr:hypothetical protein [bacterium]
GQWVSNGVYYLKVSVTDQFGNVTTVTQAVDVIGGRGLNTLEIFNSAGELVREFDLQGLSSTAQNMSLAGGPNAVASSTNPVTGAVTGGVNLILALANGWTQTLFWDGLGNGGSPLQSGVYLLELVRTQPGQDPVVKALSVNLIESKDASAQAMAASAVLGPNPVVKGEGFKVRYASNGRNWALGRLYSEDGQLVEARSDAAGGGTLSFSGAVAPGIYILDFEVHAGAVAVARRGLKVAVIR